MSFNESVLSRYINYPLTHSYLNEWITNKDYELKEAPEFLQENWNDHSIVENYLSELVNLIPFFCQFPNNVFIDKIKSSYLLKSLEHWIISFKIIENCVDILIEKYPELKKDETLYTTSKYIRVKCSSEIYQIVCLHHKDIKMDIKNQFENLRRRIKETPNNVLKSENMIANFTNAMMGEIVAKKQNKILKDELYTFENFFDNKKNSLKSLLDNIIISLLLRYQKTYENEDGIRRLLSILPGGKHREILREIPLHVLGNYNQRELFRDLFNFLKVFAVDEKLLSKEEYDEKAGSINNKEEYPYNSYKDYMENKAKIIFGLT